MGLLDKLARRRETVLASMDFFIHEGARADITHVAWNDLDGTERFGEQFGKSFGESRRFLFYRMLLATAWYGNMISRLSYLPEYHYHTYRLVQIIVTQLREQGPDASVLREERIVEHVPEPVTYHIRSILFQNPRERNWLRTRDHIPDVLLSDFGRLAILPLVPIISVARVCTAREMRYFAGWLHGVNRFYQEYPPALPEWGVTATFKGLEYSLDEELNRKGIKPPIFSDLGY